MAIIRMHKEILNNTTMEMDKVILAWLVLSTWATVAQSLEFGREAATIHSLVATIKVLQGMSITKLGKSLHIPAIGLITPEKSKQSSRRGDADRSQSALRQVLDTTCRIRDQVDSLESVHQEIPDDIEINAMLLAMKQIQRDSCHGLATSVSGDLSICSEETIRDICFQWETVVYSEEAEHELKLYMKAVDIAFDESYSKQKTVLTASEIMTRYLSSEC